ncbi:MAG: NusG domain II-containing protein [Acholeplasmatales bacterium]|nr:NusG domain II-containing protein [Acholeplasmatales bacterium]
MERKLKFGFRFGDFIAICLVVFFAIIVFLGYFIGTESVENAKVQIYQNNELLQEYPLNSTDEIIYTVEGDYTNTIVIKDGLVYFESASCPGTDCVHSGSISKPGRTLVCLPNLVEVRITGNADADIVVG